MATVLVIVANVRAYEPDKVALTEDDYVFQQFLTATADPTVTTAELKMASRSKMRRRSMAAEFALLIQRSQALRWTPPLSSRSGITD